MALLPQTSRPPKRPRFIAHSGTYIQSPEGGEPFSYRGMEFAIRASAESTGGAFSIVEEIHPLDTPPQIHHSHDELFYVLEGEHVFTVGDTEFEAGPGDLIFGPRGVPHAHRRVVPRAGRILEMFHQPASRPSSETSRRPIGTDRPESRICVESLRRSVQHLWAEPTGR